MKALVFKEGVSEWSEDGERVTHVVLVPNSTPTISVLMSRHEKVIRKKQKELAKVFDKSKTTLGYYSASFLRHFENIKRQKRLDFHSWIADNYQGKIVKFEEH